MQLPVVLLPTESIIRLAMFLVLLLNVRSLPRITLKQFVFNVITKHGDIPSKITGWWVEPEVFELVLQNTVLLWSVNIF